jgi:hypothetical protein
VHNFTGWKAHRNYSQIPAEFAHLPVICFVRNPWDWYVSMYEWSIEEDPRNLAPGVWLDMFGGGRYGFKQSVRNCCTRRSFDRKPSSGWRTLMREQGIDLYTAHHRATVRDGVEKGQIEVGRFEHLREDLLAFLDGHEVPVNSNFREAVRSSPPARVSRRGAYQHYYDEELRDLVASRCPLVEEYGYSFDDQSEPLSATTYSASPG